MVGKQIVLYSMLVMYSFDTESMCEKASEIAHAEDYKAGGCFKTYEYVLPEFEAPLPRPDDLWKSVSGGRE
jgi:hypothetical protein